MKRNVFCSICSLLVMMLAPCQRCHAQLDEGNTAFCVENEAAHMVMTASNANFCTTTSCFGPEFFDKARTYRPDQPAAKTIVVKDSRATSANIILATDRRLKRRVLEETCRLSDGTCHFVLRNLVPGVTYHYRVTADDGKRVITFGTIETTGQLRMIALETGFNIRDLGGWKGLNGRSLRYERLYRGGSLGGTDKDGVRSDIAEGDKAELQRLGIGAILDLRAATNAGKYAGESSLHSYAAGKVTIPGTEYNNTMTDYGAYNEDASIVSDIAWIIYELRKGRNVYFNCRQGADRTGTIAFVIEGLLGCYEHQNAAGGNQMAVDYEMTGFSQANLVDNWKVTTSCRPAAEAYTNRHKLFRQLLDLEAAEPDIQLHSLQERCYYYLNRYTPSGSAQPWRHIDREDLDWFICFMLDMKPREYAPFHPSWAAEGDSLKDVGEACSNVCCYE